MRKIASPIAAAFMVAVFLHNAWGQIYQYTDKNGVVIITDKPPAGSNTKEKRFKEGGVYWGNQSESDYSSYKENKNASSAPAGEERKKDYGRVTAVMYMTDWCGYCKQARQYIHSLGAGLIEYNIERDPDKKNEMKKKSGGSTAVPLIDIDGTIIRGYSPGAIRAALDRSAR